MMSYRKGRSVLAEQSDRSLLCADHLSRVMFNSVGSERQAWTRENLDSESTKQKRKGGKKHHK